MYARHPTCPACSAYRRHMAELHRCWFEHHTGHHGLHPQDVPPMPKPKKPFTLADIPTIQPEYGPPGPPGGVYPPYKPRIDIPGYGPVYRAKRSVRRS